MARRRLPKDPVANTDTLVKASMVQIRKLQKRLDYWLLKDAEEQGEDVLFDTRLSKEARYLAKSVAELTHEARALDKDHSHKATNLSNEQKSEVMTGFFQDLPPELQRSLLQRLTRIHNKTRSKDAKEVTNINS